MGRARDDPAVGRHRGAGGARRTGGLGLRPRYGILEGQGEGARADAGCGAGPPRRGRPADRADRFDLVPAATRQRLALPTLAGEGAHPGPRPADEEAAALGLDNNLAPGASRRLAFEAALVAQLAFLLRRAAAAPGAVAVPPTLGAAMRARVEAALAYALTATQARALDEIAVSRLLLPHAAVAGG